MIHREIIVYNNDDAARESSRCSLSGTHSTANNSSCDVALLHPTNKRFCSLPTDRELMDFGGAKNADLDFLFEAAEPQAVDTVKEQHGTDRQAASQQRPDNEYMSNSSRFLARTECSAVTHPHPAHSLDDDDDEAW